MSRVNQKPISPAVFWVCIQEEQTVVTPNKTDVHVAQQWSSWPQTNRSEVQLLSWTNGLSLLSPDHQKGQCGTSRLSRRSHESKVPGSNPGIVRAILL